jgi:hypothetical protein
MTTHEATEEKVETAALDPKQEKALNAIRRFCSKPYADNGKKRTSGDHIGWFERDWADLVQDLSYIDYGHIQKLPAAWAIGNIVRKSYRNGVDWNTRVNAPGVHDHILEMIRSGLTALEAQPVA